MTTRLVITDVTDMGIDMACVAGIDLGDHRTVRLETPRPRQQLLRSIGGLIPGSLVQVDWKPRPSPVPPHVEDSEWDPATLDKFGGMNEEEFIEFLSTEAFDGVVQAFGEPSIRGTGGNAAFQPGRGQRSLATIHSSIIHMVVWPEKIRVNFQDGAGDQWNAVPFQDLAVKRHRASCDICASSLDQNLRREFEGANGLLRVGLAREWNGGCWLQVNTICSGRREHFATVV